MDEHGTNALPLANDRNVLDYHRLSTHGRMSLPYLFIWLAIVAFGLLMMFSASYGISFVQSSSAMRAQLREAGLLDPNSPVGEILAADASALARKQAFFTLLGVFLGLMVAGLFKFRVFSRRIYSITVYFVVTIGLVYCAMFGRVINGARRWIDLGFTTFQPSELAKVGAVFVLAAYLSRRRMIRRRNPQKKPLWRRALLDVTLPACLMIVWIVLVALQPHLSGAIILTMVCFCIFFLADIPWKSWMMGIAEILLIVIVLGAVAGWGYQKATGNSAVEFVEQRFAHAYRRVGTHQDRDAVSEDDRMQIEQAEIALGSGGWTGKGIGRGVQKLNWLSEAHNDFILPVIGEELGFVGVMAVILLYLVFLLAGLNIARRAATHMAMLVAAGYTLLITIQAFLNMAVATSLIPATGISLPFLSYGGTSNFFFALACGMVLCVSKSATVRDRELSRVLDGRDGRRNAVPPPVLLEREERVAIDYRRMSSSM
ncbi:MAG: FtsW/RodA/SpoVE family cell cycle protein [Saccharofermentanales bacterium]|jgi:cell division protein FtsW